MKRIYFKKYNDIIKPSQITTNPLEPDTDKFLLINNNEVFDYFTNIYGYISDNDNCICIKWHIVAQNFKGIGVTKLENRLYQAMYYAKPCVSWICNLDIKLDEFTVFHKNSILMSESNSDNTDSDTCIQQ